MGLFVSIWMLVLGLLGAANLVIARKPEAAELIAKLAPYQGWIGAVSAIWGVWTIISSILNIGWLTSNPIWWATYLALGICLLVLGGLLGIGVIKTFVTQPEAHEKMDVMLAKVAPYQGTFGLIGMGLGIWAFLATFIIL